MPDHPTDLPPVLPADLPPEDASGIDGMIASHLDNSLEAPQAKRLFASLKADPRARRMLLTSAVQASVLARDALDDSSRSTARFPGAGAREPRGARQPMAGPRRRMMWAAIAAGLAVASAVWWTHADHSEHLLRLDASVATTAMRGGSPLDLTGDPWLRPGDHIVVGAGEAKLSWPDEGTSVTIGSGSELDVVSVDHAKQLRLPRGRITAEVATQGSGRGFSIATARGEISVVGTQFAVAADGRATAVHVDHGVVRVAPADGSPATPVEAGFDAVCDGQGPIRVTAAPKADTPSAPSAQKMVRVDAASFAAYTDRLGTVVGEDIVAAKGSVQTGDESVVKIQFRAPGGDLMPMGADFALHASLDVDEPTTVAVLLVYEHPEASGSWMGNVQAERLLTKGAHDLAFTFGDFACKAGEAATPQAQARISMVVVMAYSSTVKLALHEIELRGSAPHR